MSGERDSVVFRYRVRTLTRLAVIGTITLDVLLAWFVYDAQAGVPLLLQALGFLQVLLLIGGVTLLFGWFVVLLVVHDLLWAKRACLQMDEDGLRWRSWRGPVHFRAWDDIVFVGWVPHAGTRLEDETMSLVTRRLEDSPDIFSRLVRDIDGAAAEIARRAGLTESVQVGRHVGLCHPDYYWALRKLHGLSCEGPMEPRYSDLGWWWIHDLIVQRRRKCLNG